MLAPLKAHTLERENQGGGTWGSGAQAQGGAEGRLS
jgi:hypothetical protein